MVDQASEQRRAQLAFDLRIVARRAARTDPELASLARAFASRLDRHDDRETGGPGEAASLNCCGTLGLAERADAGAAGAFCSPSSCVRRPVVSGGNT